MDIEEVLKKEAAEELRKNRKVDLLEYNVEPDNDITMDLKRYPHAFLLACFMDRRISASRAWKIPMEIKKEFGTFEISDLYKKTKKDYEKIFKKLSLHINNNVMAEVFYKAVHKIVDEYDGDASKLWSDNPSSATLIYRLMDFDGVGVKIATMTSNILSRVFQVKMQEHYSIDISPDRHIRRVFKRMGLVKDATNVNKIIYKAREICPTYPGILDLNIWRLGQETCTSQNPKCATCKYAKICPKII